MKRGFALDYPCALVTGASSGIGAAYAEILAVMGCDLVLVARSTDVLEATAARLRAEHGTRVDVMPADLAMPSPGAPLLLAVKSRGLQIDLLVNNAGFCTVGDFSAQDALREQQEIALNAGAVVDLCHAFLPGMIGRGRGAILNVASLAGTQPLPYMSVYAATKAFVLSFSLGLWAELRGTGVRVLCVCPGPVDTSFYAATGESGLRQSVPRRLLATAGEIAEESLAALQRGRPLLIPGAANALAALGGQLLPRTLLAAIAARMMRRRR